MRLSENLPQLLELMADVARNATFPQNEVDLYKQNRVQSLLAEHADPGFLAGEKWLRMVYGTSPYAHIAPTRSSIGKTGRAGAGRVSATPTSCRTMPP